MGVEHLQDKRTGRPSGSKSRPAWVRAVQWAERHLGRPEAVPPSPLAGLLLAMGREHPDRLLGCLALAGSQGLDGQRDDAGRTIRVRGRSCPRRVVRMAIPEHHFVQCLKGGRGPWVKGLPEDMRIIEFEVDPVHREVVLTIESGTFEEVATGAEIPVKHPSFAYWPK